MTANLQVNEIYRTIQGEGTRAGRPCVMVRLAGCNLNCTWCDTPYARTEGREMPVDEILRRVSELNCPMVEVTGGEPLVQAGAPELLGRLCDAGWETLLETNGSLDVGCVDQRVVKILDIKCPSSGQADKNRWENLPLLGGRDEIKFVLADRRDYEYARGVLAERGLAQRHVVTFSPVHGHLAPAELAGWILQDGLDVRLGVQLHKIIFPGADRGV